MAVEQTRRQMGAGVRLGPVYGGSKAENPAWGALLFILLRAEAGPVRTAPVGANCLRGA